MPSRHVLRHPSRERQPLRPPLSTAWRLRGTCRRPSGTPPGPCRGPSGGPPGPCRGTSPGPAGPCRDPHRPFGGSSGPLQGPGRPVRGLVRSPPGTWAPRSGTRPVPARDLGAPFGDLSGPRSGIRSASAGELPGLCRGHARPLPGTPACPWTRPVRTPTGPRSRSARVVPFATRPDHARSGAPVSPGIRSRPAHDSPATRPCPAREPRWEPMGARQQSGVEPAGTRWGHVRGAAADPSGCRPRPSAGPATPSSGTWTG